MREVKSSSGFAMNAYVILDDHFHWIITPVGQNFSAIMQSIKLRFVHRYKKAIGKKEQATLWQRRFWDHVIRNDEDLHRHMDYIHYNPVKHGLVKQVSQWPYSTYHQFLKQGFYKGFDWSLLESSGFSEKIEFNE